MTRLQARGLLVLAVALTLAVGARAVVGWRTRGQVDEVWQRCQREGVLRVGLDASYPPFEVEEEGVFRGLDIDLAQAIAGRLGLEVRFTNTSFDGLYDALASGRADVLISALPYDGTKTPQVFFTGGYFNAGQVVLARREDASIRSYADLAGRHVAVEMGSRAHQEARRLRDREQIPLTIEATGSGDEAFDLVLAGAADAALADMVTARLAVGSRPGLEVRGAPLTDESFVIAVRRDSPELYAAVKGVLDRLRAEGWLEELADGWF